VGFERASDVQAIVYSVNDGSAVFVVPNGFVVLEVPLSQTQAEYFKMYEKSPNVFVLHGKAKFHYVCDCEVELVGFSIEKSKLTNQLVNPSLFSHIDKPAVSIDCIYDDMSAPTISPGFYC
jgi:hypothetical protein